MEGRYPPRSATSGVSCDSDGKHDDTTKYKNVVGRDENGKLMHFLVPASQLAKKEPAGEKTSMVTSRKRRAPPDDTGIDTDEEGHSPVLTVAPVVQERRVPPSVRGADPVVPYEVSPDEIQELD